MRYSAFDLQLNKTTKICNKRTMTGVISAVRRLVEMDGDIDQLTDEEMFKEWKYALISHKGFMLPNTKVDFQYLKNMENVSVLI